MTGTTLRNRVLLLMDDAVVNYGDLTCLAIGAAVSLIASGFQNI